MSEIKKLRIKASNAKKKKTPKIMISTQDALKLVEEITELELNEQQTKILIETLREQIAQSEQLLHLANDSPKILNITGGKFK